MPPVELPALDGRDPLGFLAALGLLRVATRELGADARLAFSHASGCAMLHSPLPTTEAVADMLAGVIARIPPKASLDGVGPGFPFPKKGKKGSDPMRVLREEYRELVARVQKRVSPEEALRWLAVLVTDQAVDRRGRVAITPYHAPSGEQTLETYISKPLSMVRCQPRRLREALVGWRRVDGFTGEYLDHRVIRSAVDHPRGESKSTEAGVPGATWLAIQALPFLRVTGDGTHRAATLWHRVNGRTVMLWPLWHLPLDAPAVQVLIEHPALTPIGTSGRVTVDLSRLRPLGVFACAGAERQPIAERKFEGVLTPLRVEIA